MESGTSVDEYFKNLHYLTEHLAALQAPVEADFQVTLALRGLPSSYILTRNVPDDGNISTVGDSSSDEGDQIATQTDMDSDSQEQADESADEDQESGSSEENDDESASSVDANVTSNWSSV